MDRNHADYFDAMVTGAYLIESYRLNAPLEGPRVIKHYCRLMSRALLTNTAQFSVDVRDQWNKTYGGKKAIK